MQTEQFEIVVILEGIVETTGEWLAQALNGGRLRRVKWTLAEVVVSSAKVPQTISRSLTPDIRWAFVWILRAKKHRRAAVYSGRGQPLCIVEDWFCVAGVWVKFQHRIALWVWGSRAKFEDKYERWTLSDWGGEKPLQGCIHCLFLIPPPPPTSWLLFLRGDNDLLSRVPLELGNSIFTRWVTPQLKFLHCGQFECSCFFFFVIWHSWSREGRSSLYRCNRSVQYKNTACGDVTGRLYRPTPLTAISREIFAG